MQVERQSKRTVCFWNTPGQLLTQKPAHGYHTRQQGIPSKNDRTIPRSKRGQHYSRWLVERFGNNSDQAINSHNQNMRAYLLRCRQEISKLTSTNVNSSQLPTLTNAGLKPDEEKVREIPEFQVPHGLHHLKRFIGMVKYLPKFYHSLTTKCEPWYRLTRKDLVF